MDNFQVGDTVRRIKNDHTKMKVGEIGVISHISFGGSWVDIEGRSKIGNELFSKDRLELVNNKSIESATNNKKMINLVVAVKNMFRSEPEKSFIKVGVMDENGKLTEEGKQVFINYLFDQNKAAFNTAIVQPLIAEIEAEEKK